MEPLVPVIIPDEFDIGVTKDGHLKIRDRATGKILTRYQVEKMKARDTGLGIYLEALKAWFLEAKAERRRRWQGGEKWYELDIDQQMREFTKVLNQAADPNVTKQ